MRKHLLFVCSSNLDRSPVAESLFVDSDKYKSRSCGILPHAETVISKDAIKWADVIFCMEHEHKAFILENFPEALKKDIVVLGISNDFLRNDPLLISLLKEKLNKYLNERK